MNNNLRLKPHFFFWGVFLAKLIFWALCAVPVCAVFVHRRSVAVLCMLYKIRYNPMNPLNGALPGLYVPVRVPRGALVAHWYTYAPPRCRTSLYVAGLLFHSQCPSGKILLTLCSMVWDWWVSRARPMLFYWLKQLYPYYSILLFFTSILSVYRLVMWGWGPRTYRVFITLS